MRQIEINPSNKPYYSENFIKGFECGTKTQFDVDKEVIDRIKQAREEIFETHKKHLSTYGWSNIMIAVEIMDKLISEMEGEE